MKKLFLLVVIAMFVFACGSRQTQTQIAEESVKVLTVDELMASAAENVDHEVVIAGLITHVCKHGGQRCFVMGATDDVSIRVEAGDEIESFKQEHVGDELKIVGILRLVPVEGGHECSEEDAAAIAAANTTSEAAEGEVEVSADETYVPRYYIDGLRFEVIAEGAESEEEGAE
jgi:hypothetical protein